MKSVILILCLLCFVSASAQTPWWWYKKHKSETKIAQMTPDKRVDEYIDENFHHRWDVLDEQSALIEKYILIDGKKALPRIIERMGEYDPSRPGGGKTAKYWKFEGCWFLINSMDMKAFRLRASEEGRRAINALEKSVERMKTAGYEVDDIDNATTHSHYGIFVMVGNNVKQLKGINFKDISIQDTFRYKYKIKLSDDELLDFSNYLTEYYPEYPSWSEGKGVKDDTDISPAGYPTVNTMLVKPERYYEAYLEFKKIK